MENRKYTSVIVEKLNQTSWVRLNRPEVHNAMNAIMISELTEIFGLLAQDKKIRVVVLSGNGSSFCAGADLNYMKGIAAYGYNENVEDGKKLAALFNAIYNCPIPTIALVHGVAFGGANGLLSACDIVVAEADTTFAFSEVKLGIAPATISPFVIKRIGEFGAKELMMTGKRFKVNEALRWNLVNHIYKKGEDKPLHSILKEFYSSAPKAVKESKKLIKRILESSIDESMEYTANLIAKLRASQEGQEGMTAFLENRKPQF